MQFNTCLLLLFLLWRLFKSSDGLYLTFIVESTIVKGQTCEGQKVPNVTFRTRVRDDTIKPNPFKWKDVTTDDLFKVINSLI